MRAFSLRCLLRPDQRAPGGPHLAGRCDSAPALGTKDSRPGHHLTLEMLISWTDGHGAGGGGRGQDGVRDHGDSILPLQGVLGLAGIQPRNQQAPRWCCLDAHVCVCVWVRVCGGAHPGRLPRQVFLIKATQLSRAVDSAGAVASPVFLTVAVSPPLQPRPRAGCLSRPLPGHGVPEPESGVRAVPAKHGFRFDAETHAEQQRALDAHYRLSLCCPVGCPGRGCLLQQANQVGRGRRKPGVLRENILL